MKVPQVTVTQIRCIMPSAGVDVDAQKNAELAKTILEGAGEVVEVIPEIGEIVGPLLQVAGALTAAVADAVASIEKAMRDNGGDPDQLYVTVYFAGGPSARKGVQWPVAGQEDPTTVDLAKGQQVSGNPLFTTTLRFPDLPFNISPPPQFQQNIGLAFWDRDQEGAGSDDLLFQLPLAPNGADPKYLGQQVVTLYNPKQDCTYEVHFLLEEIDQA